MIHRTPRSSFVLLAAGIASAVVTTAAIAESPILITIRVLQVDESHVSAQTLNQGLSGLTYTGLPADYKGDLPAGHPAMPRDARAELTLITQAVDGSSTVLRSPGTGMGFVSADGTISLGDRTIRMSDTAAVASIDSSDSDSPFTCVSAPRMMVNPAQQAEMMIGRPVTYLEPAPNGLFRAVDLQDAFEGVSIKTVASHDDQGRIVLDSLDITLSEVASRFPVPGLSLDAGRPMMRTSSINASLTMPDGMAALIPFMDGAEKPKLSLLVLISVEDAKADEPRR